MKQLAEPALAEASTPGVIAFDAPYLIEKLLKEGIVDSSQEGEDLFLEFKRWLLLAQSDRSKLWPMFSSRIDAVWHHFILYTREYAEFCEQHFGRYVQHAPGNAPKHPDTEGMDIVSFDLFCEKYTHAFGKPPPETWRDITCVTLNRRIVNLHAGHLEIRVNDLMLQMLNPDARRFLIHDEKQMFHLINVRGAEILRVGAAAGDALEFLAKTPSFYVRELPGNLASGEKIALVSTLIDLGILKVAA